MSNGRQLFPFNNGQVKFKQIFSFKYSFLNFIKTEVTALRSKLFEQEINKEKIEKELREKIKAEFIDLVSDLVNVNTSLKSHIEQFKYLKSSNFNI